MKLEDQVCSLALAKRLKELGVKQDSYAYYHRNHAGWVIRLDRENIGVDWADNEIVSSFTVAELGEILDFRNYPVRDRNRWVLTFNTKTLWSGAWTEADARAQMLIYLLEKGLVKP